MEFGSKRTVIAAQMPAGNDEDEGRAAIMSEYGVNADAARVANRVTLNEGNRHQAG
jgi:hypothetical protein